MTNDLKPPDVVVATPDDIVLIICPRCDLKRPFSVGAIRKGVNYVCEGCGVRISTTQKTAIPSAVLEARRGEQKVQFQIMQRSDGFWVFLDDGEKSILHTLDNDSDRAIATVVASMIESRLERAMRAKLRRPEKFERDFFRPGAVLGDFGAKIDLAYFVGLISAEAHMDLKIVRDIRNIFAHHLDIMDFLSQKVRDKAANFKLIESFVAESDPTSDRFEMAFDPTAKPAIFVKHVSERMKQAKDRYLMTAQLMTIRFATCENSKCDWPLI